MSRDSLNEKEFRNLRALTGGLAWPANQRLPQLSCTVSLLQASSNSPKALHILNANKTPTFAEETRAELLHNGFADVRFGAYADAARVSGTMDLHKAVLSSCAEAEAAAAAVDELEWPKFFAAA